MNDEERNEMSIEILNNYKKREDPEHQASTSADYRPSPKKAACHDCGVTEGEMHAWGCDMEMCPFCGRQLISCGCYAEETRQPSVLQEDDLEPLCALTGLTLDEAKGFQNAISDIWFKRALYKDSIVMPNDDEFKEKVEKRGRVPFIEYPIICARCGELWPDFFMVSNEEWGHYIQPDQRWFVLCRECYDEIKALIDNAEGDDARGEEDEQA